MGVSGSGKSTVAGLLAAGLGWPLVEGDELHPPANIAKMSAGQPLTDADRWPWLDAVAGLITERIDAGESVVVTCSALQRSYRDVLRRSVIGHSEATLTFVYLAGTRDELHRRLAARTGHFMPPELLDSQLAALEDPTPEPDVRTIDIGPPPAEVAAAALAALRNR
ncbi:gluconokinase [Nocardia sp. 2]|uniref:Gluconokinase n=1 Tax=Nocardia acididurans TaxID=2802282 RepID=A0ABS1M2C5_9NOCA|nr:gluconokinase [Nocardia acididurans]MBL1074690.1 gluconokinase [Nocardia acididurans]